MKKERIKKTSVIMETLERTVKAPSTKVGVAILVIMILACFLAPLYCRYGFNEMDLSAMYKGPSLAHPAGTDGLGRDCLTRLLYGGRYSILIGITVALFGALIGIVIGCVAGYFGGKVETIIMRIMDVWSAMPGMLLCILISSALGSSFFNTVLALSIGNVPGNVRMIRGQILQERTKEYLEAAESIDCSKLSIMFKHLLPNVIAPLIVSCSMSIGNNITMSATLSYIGLGVQPPTPEWGAMLADARSHILVYPYLIMFPGIFIALTVLAFNLLGDGLRDALDPKLRN